MTAIVTLQTMRALREIRDQAHRPHHGRERIGATLEATVLLFTGVRYERMADDATIESQLAGAMASADDPSDVDAVRYPQTPSPTGRRRDILTLPD